MSTLLEKAKQIEKKRRHRRDITAEEWEVVKAWYSGEINSLQAAHVLCPENRSSIYNRAVVITMQAVDQGWLKL